MMMQLIISWNWLVADRICEYPKTLFEESGFFSFLPNFWDKYTNTWFFKRAKFWQKEPYSTCLKPIFRLTLGTHNSNFGYVYEISLVLTIVIDFQKEIFHTVCISKKKNLHLPQFLSLKKVAKNYYQSISGAALRSIAVDKTPKKVHNNSISRKKKNCFMLPWRGAQICQDVYNILCHEFKIFWNGNVPLKMSSIIFWRQHCSGFLSGS